MSEQHLQLSLPLSSIVNQIFALPIEQSHESRRRTNTIICLEKPQSKETKDMLLYKITYELRYYEQGVKMIIRT